MQMFDLAYWLGNVIGRVMSKFGAYLRSPPDYALFFFWTLSISHKIVAGWLICGPFVGQTSHIPHVKRSEAQLQIRSKVYCSESPTAWRLCAWWEC